MASTRRAQVRSLLKSHSGAVVDRAESYLAAVDVWAHQGNAKIVQRVGPGLVAVCCYLAAQSLDETGYVRATFEKASGLTPLQFRHAERDLKPAFAHLSSTPATPATPVRSRIASQTEVVRSPSASSSTSATPKFDPFDRSPQALRAKAMAVQDGSLFQRQPVPLTPSNRIEKRTPFTPSKSSPLKRQIEGFDNAVRAKTVTPKAKVRRGPEQLLVVEEVYEPAELPGESWETKLDVQQVGRRRKRRIVFGFQRRSRWADPDAGAHTDTDGEAERNARLQRLGSVADKLETAWPPQAKGEVFTLVPIVG
ncbi:hypothetical protein ACQY0O_007816 [Thecaphora frezii]